MARYPHPKDNALPPTARIESLRTGEHAYILDAVTRDPATGEWTAYRVVTGRGLEIWRRDEFDLTGSSRAVLADARNAKERAGN